MQRPLSRPQNPKRREASLPAALQKTGVFANGPVATTTLNRRSAANLDPLPPVVAPALVLNFPHFFDCEPDDAE